MTFNSLQYAALLPLVLIVYWALGRRAQNVLLLAASYVFYGAFDWRFLGLLMASTLTDYLVGRMLAVTEDERQRRLTFLLSLGVNLGILGFFKYFDFFVTDGARLLGQLGIDVSPPVLRVLLPVGISFYTFHGISYTFDVFRKDIEPTRSLLDFAVFVAFFPQLVAGPIGRARRQLPQFARERSRPDASLVRRSVLLIVLGLFKKVAIADMLAPYVDRAFAAGSPTETSSVGLIVGVWAFALQIYGDFSGYSDIARGSAFLLGIELPENFNQPYLARSVTEFWRRWHISLSNWLRDYLYVPLGGNRRGRLATYRNLLLTMLIGGLWHGAALTFVVWGGLHGLYLAGERRFVRASAEPAERSWSWPRDALRAFATFQLVCVAWVFFRADSVGSALSYLGGIVRLQGGTTDRAAVAMVALAAAAMLLIDALQHRARDHTPMLTWRPAARGLAYGLMIVPIVIFSGGTPVPFIYFQF